MDDRVQQNSDDIRKTNSELRSQVRYLEGRNTRLENTVDALKEKVEDLEYRSMRENIIVYNIPELPDEDCYSLVKKVFTENMKCEDSSRILIDVAHRLGQKRFDHKPRPIVAKMLSRASKSYVMSHVRNLKGCEYSVGDQLPKTMQERRLAQLSTFKKVRKEPGSKAKLIKDQLYINNKLQAPHFENRPIKPVAADDIAEIFWFEHDEVYERGSRFWGFSTSIFDWYEAENGLSVLLENATNEDATHMVYAYRYKEGDDLIEGHSDDGEIGASKILLDALKSKNVHALIVVCREYGGVNLGKKRFEIYNNIAGNLAQQARSSGELRSGLLPRGALARGASHSIRNYKVRANDILQDDELGSFDSLLPVSDNTISNEESAAIAPLPGYSTTTPSDPKHS